MTGKKFQAFFFFCFLLLLSGCVSSSIYYPLRQIRHTPADAGLVYEDVVVTTRDNIRISCWWVPAEDSKGTVLFCHGNGGNNGSYMDSIAAGNRLGMNVFIFDYRGYGRSEGSPSEQGIYLDADAAYRYLTETRKISPENIIIWGRSLGGSIAARTAAEHKAGLLILESTFTTLRELVRDLIGWTTSRFVSREAYDTIRSLEKVTYPVLVIHSPDDEVVPFDHGKKLYDSVKGPKAFVEIRGSHNRGFIESQAVFESSINDFIDRYFLQKERTLP
jgi:uncharacterized protein